MGIKCVISVFGFNMKYDRLSVIMNLIAFFHLSNASRHVSMFEYFTLT